VAEFHVRYSGSDFGAATPSLTESGKVMQERRPQLSVLMLYRNAAPKKAHQGANAYIARARAALRGFTIPAAPDVAALTIARDGHIQPEDPAIWPYEFIFTTSLTEVYDLAAPVQEEEP
jgi:hypothetical protein